MVALRWGASTDPGRVRTENEDTFVAEDKVFAVADGMGGHQAGEVASALAASVVRDRLGSGAVSEDAAAAVVVEANAAIYGAAKANPLQSGMGTTLTALALLNDGADTSDQRFVLLNVGDSRTYRFRHGRLQRVTVDHSYVQELVAAGHITIDEARTHPRRNIVTRALGIEPFVRADMWTLPVVRGDRFVLASDGLVDEVADDEILGLVAGTDDPQQLAEQLVEIANRHGGRDNVTVVVVDVLDGADPPDPTEELELDPSWADDPTGSGVWGAPTAGITPLAPLTAADIDPITRPDPSARPTAPPTPDGGDAAGVPSGSPPPPPSEDELAPLDDAERYIDTTVDTGIDTGSSESVETDTRDSAAVDAELTDAIGADTTAAEIAGETTTTAAMPATAAAPVTQTPADASLNATAVMPVLPGPASAATGGDPRMRIAESAAADDAPPAHEPPPRSRRRFGVGMFLFVTAIAAIIAVTLTVIAVHARSGYFVGFDGDTVVIYKGQRDSVLWFDPTVNTRSAKTRDQLSAEVIRLVEANTTFDSAEAAAAFIDAEVTPTTVPTTTDPPATTTTVASSLPALSTTTTVPTGG